MFVVANLLIALANLLQAVLTAYWFIMLVRCLISWVNPDPNNQIVLFLHRITDPLLREIRRLIPFCMAAGIDFSPIIAFLLISFAKSFLVNTLIDIAMRIK